MGNVIHLYKMAVMNNFVYVVSLVGSHVFHDWSIKAIIKYIDDLDKVRAMIRDNHGVEFEDKCSHFYNGWWCFDNITDDRDIKMIVERVDIIE